MEQSSKQKYPKAYIAGFERGVKQYWDCVSKENLTVTGKPYKTTEEDNAYIEGMFDGWDEEYRHDYKVNPGPND
jgi:hypothetical protein